MHGDWNFLCKDSQHLSTYRGFIFHPASAEIFTNMDKHLTFDFLESNWSDQAALLQDAVPVSLRRTATKQQCEIQPLPHAMPGTQEFMGLALGDNQSSSFPLPRESSLL